LADNEFGNLCRQSNTINSPSQSKVLGNNHADEDGSIDIYDDECPGAQFYLLVSQ